MQNNISNMMATVTSKPSATFTLPLRPYQTIDWLVTVPVTNKFDGKGTNNQSGSASFAMVNKLQNEHELVPQEGPKIWNIQ